MIEKQSVVDQVDGLSPIAADIVRLLDYFRKLLKAGNCDIQTAFIRSLHTFAFPNIHLTSYKPFPLDRNKKNTVHFSEMCTDECEFHNDLLRMIYAHITGYFFLTSWRRDPIIWAFAIQLLVAVYYTIPLPHSISIESEDTYSHMKYKIPMSPHVIRQIRRFSEYILQYKSFHAESDIDNLPKLSADEISFATVSILAMQEGNIYRITPSMETWYAEELNRVHSALNVSKMMDTS